MNRDLFSNYGCLYNMVLSTTLLSNAESPETKADQKKIIEFIGRANRLTDNDIAELSDIILSKLSSIALVTDQKALYANRNFSGENDTEDILLDIKASAIGQVQALMDQGKANVDPNWFDYTYYKVYESRIRFSNLSETSASGNLITTRLVGIMNALGIGTEKNMVNAERKFLYASFWGDIQSMKLAAYCYGLDGKEEESKDFYDIARLCEKYLNEGVTVLPEEEKNNYSEKVCQYYAYISTIKQDIIFALKQPDINFSFLEAISGPDLDYFSKMSYINSYESKSWQELTNSSRRPAKKFGF